MTNLPRTPLARWRYALKPASWPKLLVPALLGQFLALEAAAVVSWRGAAYAAAFTVLDLVFIVLLNDWGDQDVDRLKRRMFPDGCSPKTIPDAILPARALLLGGSLAGALAVALAAHAESVLGRAGLGFAAAGCLAIFFAYTMPPLRLNYRGGGELLEMLGVGVALPLVSGSFQLDHVPAAVYAVLPGFAVLSLGSAVASGLSDEVSDDKGGKRTFVTMMGNTLGRRAVELCVGLGAALWLLGLMVPGAPSAIAVLPAVGLVLFEARRLRAASAAATTNAFAAQARYKAHLHAAIWRGTTLLATLHLALGLLGTDLP